MKTFYIIPIFSLFLILSCNKEEKNPNSGDPITYNVYLDLQKSDGTSFGEGEIEAKGGFFNEEGELVFNGDWFLLPVSSDYTDIFGKSLFGPFEIGVSSEGNDETEPGTEWVSNQLLLLRYQGISEIDTLRSRDSSRYPDYRYFDVFKNDTLIERFNDPENYIERPWYIIIQK